MLTPDYLKGCTEEIIQVYQELEDSITRDVVRRLMITDFEIPQSAVWQVEKLQEAGKTYDDVLSSIGRMTGKSEKELKKLFTDAGTRTLRYDDQVYRDAGLNPLPIQQSPGMLQTLTAGYKKCGKELKNLTLTTANTSQTQFIHACDKAYFEITSGAFDYNTAIRRAIESVGQEGAYVLYPSGHRDRLDVAVRRAALTGVSQTCGQLQWDRADEMGCDLVEVTAHYGARPDHAEWQGQIYSRSGKHKDYPDFASSTGYGTVEGLMGANCRHDFYPFFEGISSPAYTKDELMDMKNKTVSYNGENVPEYEASQKQRAMERSIRAEKRTLTALNEAMKNTSDDELKRQLQADFEKHSVKLKGKEARLADFLNQTGRAEDRARVQVSGFGKGLANKAVAANKRGLKAQEERAIIKEIKACGIKGEVMFPPFRKQHAYILEDRAAKDPAHIMHRMMERQITADDIQKYVDSAVFSVEQFRGTRKAFYSKDGVAVLTKSSDYAETEWIVKTAWSKADFDENVDKALKEALKYGK